jgi:hypothetical protein
MKLPMRIRILAAIVTGGVVVASSACGVDSPNQATAPSSLSPSLASSASRGSTRGGSTGGSAQPAIQSTGTFPDMSRNGTYNISVDPSVANVLTFGASRLEIPANAICQVGSSSYGPDYWNSSCALESRTLQLTITVNSTSLGGSVDFNPALRFDPAQRVSLTLSAPQVKVADAKNWVILYCPSATSTTSGKGSGGSGSGKDGNKCVNESLTDKDLQTYIDYDLRQLFRRIKHFSRYSVSDGSGYVVGE